MVASQAIRAGKAFVEVFSDDSKLVRGLRGAEQKLKAFGTSVSTMGLKLVGLGAAVLGPLQLAVNEFSDVGDTFNKMALRTGASAEALSQLGFAAEQSGADLGAVEKSLAGMQRTLLNAERMTRGEVLSIQDLADGSSRATWALAQLGLKFDDLKGQTPESQFKAIAQGLSNVDDPSRQAALALQIFGESGRKLLPLLQMGSEGIESLMREADALGLTVTTEDAQVAADYADAWNRVKRSLQAVVFQVGAAVAPLLTDILGTLKLVTSSVVAWVRENRALILGVAELAAVVAGVGAAIFAVGTAIVGLGAVLGGIATILASVGAAFGAVAAAIGTLLSPIGLAVTAIIGLGGWFLHVSGIGARVFRFLRGVFEGLKERALSTFEGIRAALAAGDMAAAARVLWSALKLEWMKGIAFVGKKWVEFKSFFLDVWDNAVTSAAKLFSDAFFSIQSAWIEVVHGMRDAWLVLQNFVAKGILRLKAQFDDSFDLELAMTVLEAGFGVQIGASDRERRDRLKEIEQERKDAAAEIEAQAERDREAREGRFKKDLEDRAQAVKDAKDEWEAARAAAKELQTSAKAAGEGFDLEDLLRSVEAGGMAAEETRNRALELGTREDLNALLTAIGSGPKKSPEEETAEHVADLVGETQKNGKLLARIERNTISGRAVLS